MRLKQKGLTLLELILSMTMLSFVTLSITGFSTASLRLTMSSAQQIKLQNEIQYVLRHMDQIRDGYNVGVCGTSNCLEFTDVDGSINRYRYNEGTSTLTYRGSRGPESMISQGILVPMFGVDQDGVRRQLNIFEVDQGEIRVNLAAQTTLPDGVIVSVAGVTKSFLARGGPRL